MGILTSVCALSRPLSVGIGRRGAAEPAVKLLGIVLHAGIAQKHRDFSNTHFLFAKQSFAFLQADVGDVFCRCHAKIAPKQNGELGRTDIHGGSKCVNGQLSVNAFRHGLHSLVQDHAVCPFRGRRRFSADIITAG